MNPSPAESVRLLTLARDLAQESSTRALAVGDRTMGERLEGAAIAFDTALAVLDGREDEAAIRNLYGAEALRLKPVPPPTSSP